MGKWEKKQIELKEAKEKNNTTKEIIAKYFLDLSKLVFAAIVLEGFSPMFSDTYRNVNLEIIAVGAITTISFSLLGYKTLKSR